MTPTVVYLDGYHLGDPLFIPGLARDLAARTTGIVLVHGSGERGERALESLGLVPQSADGVWAVDGDHQRGAVERATRELNREMIHEFNEQGVSAVGVMAGDRGLVHARDGELEIGKSAWLAELVGNGVTVLLGTMVEGAEVDAARVAGLLASALHGQAVAISRRSAEEPIASADLEGLVHDPESVRRVAREAGSVGLGLRVRLRSTSGSIPCFKMT